MAVQVPTEGQLRQVAADVGLSLTDDDVKSFIDLMRPSVAAYNVVDAMPDNLPRVKYPRTPGYRPPADENKHNAWYVKTRVEGALQGQAQGQDGGAEGQHHAGRRADDERRRDARGLCARHRRDRGAAHPRCRRHDRRQGALREFLPLRRQSHQRDRTGAQSLQDGLLGRRFLVGQRGAGGAGRGRHGDGRRSGRLDPHAVVVLRHLRHEADARARALYRHHADRDLCRSHRPDHRQRRRQCPAARGPGRSRRLRFAPDQRQDAPLYQGAARRHQGHEDRSGDRGFRPGERRGRRERQGQGGGQEVRGSWAPRSARSRSRCTLPGRRCGCRSAPRG